MLSVPFYYSLFKKYVILFGTLFNNIKIERVDSDGDVYQTIRVPLSYGPREKFLARIEENPTGTATAAITLPRMSFEMTGMTYASDRKLQTTRTISQTRDVNGTLLYNRVYAPVPYDINFRLQIMTKTTEDGTRILEQILPYFTPEWTVGVKLLEQFDTLSDIPLVLNSVNMEDTYEGNFEERRALIHTLDFTMKAYFYGPQRDKKVIKIAFVNLYPSNTASIVFERVTVQPGMTELGEPTSDINLTVPYSEIEEDDTYGYIVTIENLPDE